MSNSHDRGRPDASQMHGHEIALTKLQRPLSLASAGKRDARTQFGALCYRFRDNKLKILLVTSRRSKRWGIPKGWPIDGATPAEAAATEAWEEAGIKGRVHPECIGFYHYTKTDKGDGPLPCIVAVFAIRATRIQDDFPEVIERKRKWVSRKKAAKLVSDPELARILAHFEPKERRI